MRWARLAAVVVLAMGSPRAVAAGADGPSAASYGSIQEAIDANPGRMVFVPAGDHPIDRKLRLRADRSGLFGPGRIVQRSPDQPVIEIEGAADVAVRGLTLTRPEGATETTAEGILAVRCRDLAIDDVRVIDNRTASGAIRLRECRGARVGRCLVRNYMRLSIDDRTGDDRWGYAFRCTDGSGISVSESVGTLIEGNRVVEETYLPTRDLRTKHGLGDWVKRNPRKGTLMGQEAWDRGYSDNWQQGSGIVVTAPESSDLTRILGNHVENAAQGIDLHADRVVVANNVVANAFIGMKAMHGSRNVLITGNQFARNSLWAIGLMPGTAAHPANADGGSIVANNIISDFGHGDARWIWGDDRSPLRFEAGQDPDDPPLADVLVQGNLVQSVGTPRYAYAVIVSGGDRGPRGLHFANNLLPPGTQGASNVELPP